MCWRSVCVCESPFLFRKKVEFAPGMHVELKCFLIKKPLCKILIGSSLKHIKNELNQYSKIVHINTDEHTCRVEMHWS